MREVLTAAIENVKRTFVVEAGEWRCPTGAATPVGRHHRLIDLTERRG